MKILIVSHYFPPEPMRAGDVALGLQECGHEVTVLTGFPCYPTGRLYPGYKMKFLQFEDYHGIRVIRVPLYPDYSLTTIRRTLNYTSFALSASLMGPWLTGRPDSIFVFLNSPVTMAIPAVVIKALRSGRLFLWVQDLWPETLEALGILRNPRLLRLVGRMVRFLYGQAERILVQSRGFIDSVAARGVPRDRIEYVPNWAEDLYRVVPSDEAFLQAEGLTDGFKVMFAGNLGVAQNLPVLLDAAEALADHPEIRFIVVGDGSEYAALVEAARRRGLRTVVFKGRQPAHTMPQYFASADALLIQLKMNRVFEVTIPSKLQSYMACGRPIIAALAGSGAEIVSEAKAGVVCQPDNADALRDAILALWGKRTEDREQMGVNARRYYERHFDRRLILNRLQTILANE